MKINVYQLFTTSELGFPIVVFLKFGDLISFIFGIIQFKVLPGLSVSLKKTEKFHQLGNSWDESVWAENPKQTILDSNSLAKGMFFVPDNEISCKRKLF